MKFPKQVSGLGAFLWLLLLLGPTSAQPTDTSLDDQLKALRDAYRSEITPVDKIDKDRFILLIHAYNPVMAKGFIEQLKEKGTYDPARDINLLVEPQRLRDKGVVSSSIISAQQLPTFGRLLFILGFPPEDILATSPEDGYFKYKEKEILVNPPGPTMTPTQLLARTKPLDYNEVLLRSENLVILGMAVKHMVRHDGVIDTPADAPTLRALAKEKGLPFFDFYEKCVLEDLVRVATGKNGLIESILLQHNGIGYSMNHYWQQRFFHPNQMDWEDISDSEYAEIRPLLQSALEAREGGPEYLQTIDAAMKRRFR